MKSWKRKLEANSLFPVLKPTWINSTLILIKVSLIKVTLKVDRIFLLKQINLDTTGRINLTDLFNLFAKISNNPIASPILAFYNIASIIENKLKISTLEFIYKNGLSLEDEININDFYIKIADNLKIDDITTIIVFKSLDSDKKGKIQVEDFVVVIDSYREDNENSNVADKQNKNEYSKLISDINYLKGELEEDSLSVQDIYNNSKTNLDVSKAKLYEIFNNIKFLMKNINLDNVENVLNFLKKEDSQIYKQDFETLIKLVQIDQKYIVSYLQNKNKILTYNKFTLNDMQIFWVNKLCALLDAINVTPLMAYQTAAEKSKEINLDFFKRKLQKMIPPSRVSAIELNNIADSLDINKTRTIILDDFTELIELAKNDPKFKVTVKLNDDRLGGTNTLLSSFIKTKKNVNDLPVKGNTKALSILKRDLSKTHVKSPVMDKTTKSVGPAENNYIKNTKEKVEVTSFTTKPNDTIEDFIKELSVFENGEWSLIELLEDMIFKENGLITTFDLNSLLLKHFNPTIQKNKIFSVVKNVEGNQDGFVSIKDLISFLLNKIKHRSTKLALKEITRKINFDDKLSTEDYFSRKFLQPSNEMNFVNFIQFFIKNFDIEPPVVKKIFDELKSVLNKPTIFVTDLIDLINEYQEEYTLKRKNNNKENTNISLLDKKFYEEEMKSFIRILQKAFGVNFTQFRLDIDNFLNIPSTMKLLQFRESIIKPLSMDFCLGIATFQLLKSFATRETATVSKEDLFNLIESYFNTGVTQIDSEVIVYYLENKYTPLKFCFESISYSFNSVPTIDVLRMLEIFYPKVSKGILLNLIKGIDSSKLGLVTFKHLSDFLFRSSKKEMFSNELMIKYVASITDYKNFDTMSYIFKEANLKRGDSIIHLNEHNTLFNTSLRFEYEQSENLFLFLITNSPYNNGYIVDKLIRLVNTYRERSVNLLKTTVYDNTSQVEAVKALSLEFTEFLRALNENLNLAEPLSNLYISEHLQISVLDCFNVILQSYQNLLDLDKKILIKLLKSLDTEKKGSFNYETLLVQFKNYLDEFEISIPLHCKYLSSKLNKEYEGKWKDYLSYKNLIPNKYITKEQFEVTFRDECFSNEYISHNLFELLKEKKGANTNLLFNQNFVDYLTGLSKDLKNNNISGKKMSEEEAEDYIKSTIYRIERDDNMKISVLFDKLNLQSVNSFGKINSDNIRQLLKDQFNFDNFTIDVIINYFCKILTLFDLMKLVDFINSYSEKSSVNIQSIVEKIKIKIPNNKTYKIFFKNINISIQKPLSLVEVNYLLNPLFGLTNYESFFLFKEVVGNESNPLNEAYKINIDFILNNFSLYKYFLKDTTVKEEKLDVKTLNALRKFVSYLDAQPNKMKVFKQHDVDGDGLLSRTEFLILLRSCKEAGLNDSQQISILNMVDKNGDDNINFIELIDFLNTIKSQLGNTSNENLIYSAKKNVITPVISKESNKFITDKTVVPSVTSKLDSVKLKEAYEFNFKNIEIEKETQMNLILYNIQEELFNKQTMKDNLENDFVKLDTEFNETIDKDDFFKVLNKIESVKKNLNEENEENIWNYSMEGFVKKIKNHLMLENLVQYRNFFNNILNFKIKAKKITSNKLNSTPIREQLKSPIETLELVNTKTDIPVIKLKQTEEIKTKFEQTFKSKDNKKRSNLISNLGVKFDFNKPEEINKAQSLITNAFTFNTEKLSTVKQNSNKAEFKEFINKIEKTNYTGYDYKINPETDYFKRPNGQVVETILNNEDAAIKKCEEISDSLKEGFFDKDFGSQPNDNGQKNRTSLYLTGTAPKGSIDAAMIEWYRMNHICENEEPVFIDNGAEANDVCQGAIGDCWFISALSVLATKDHLLRGEFNPSILDDGVIDEEESVMLSTGVYPPLFQIFRVKNIFCFRFFKNFEWKYVIIDDRLPCRKVFDKSQPKKLLYGKCKSETEFWVPLIEKAYAKLHGCYEALVSGFIDDGLVDLTGLISRKISVDNQLLNSEEGIDKFWEMLTDYSKISFENVQDKNNRNLKALIFTRNSSMMGCSVDAKVVESEVIFNNSKSGVLAGHAYAILDTIEIPKPNGKKKRKTSRLLRIRNPWGYKEWNGKWSDESTEVQTYKQIIQISLDQRYEGHDERIDLDAEDGTFLMCYSDFRKLYNKLFVCIDFPHSYIGITFNDSWTKEESGGIPINNTKEEMINWARNPQYYLNVKKDMVVMMSLLQNDGRLTQAKFPYPESTKKTCLIISKTTGKQKLTAFDNDKVVTISPVRQHRENSVYITLAKGEYIISACTLKPGEVGAFCLEIHLEDSYTDSNYNESNFLTKLKNTEIQRLGDSTRVKVNLKKETSIEELQVVKEKKKNFIYNQFKNMLSGISSSIPNEGNKKTEEKKKKIEDDFDEF